MANTKKVSQVLDSHIDDDLINDLFTAHAYTPRMRDEDAVKMILDLVKTNTMIYSELVREMGKPSKRENKEHYEAFYRTLRQRVCAKFGIENGTYTPFVPFELITLYNEVRIRRDRAKAAELVASTAQLYRDQAIQFDDWAKQAHYLEAVS